MLPYWALCTGLLLFVAVVSHWVYRWRNPACNGKLPPGSMGVPIFGETLPFFRPSTTNELHPFVKERVERHGRIFKTNLVGRPVVVSTDAELNHLVFLQEGKLFQSWYPESFTEIFGRQNVGSLHGPMYKYLKSLVLKLVGTENLKEGLIGGLEDAARANLEVWASHPSVELKDASAAMIFNFAARKLISYNPSEFSESLQESYVAFIKGLLSFPLYVPGTAYYRCLKGRARVMKVLKEMLKERQQQNSQEKKREGCGDFFDVLIEEMKRKGTLLTEAITLDLMFVLLFASFETTSLALTMAVKFLTDHPRVLRELTEEHEAIRGRRENPDSRITWEEYKSMTFTSMVINETVRLANIVPTIFRKALEDIRVKGYTIPAGWAVVVCPPAVHMDPQVYKDPLIFNPWRWKDIPNSSGGSKNFMAFGGGMRFCVGTDFTKLLMSVFLHSLVSKYRWNAIGGGDIVRTPGLSFPNGFHIQLAAKN